MPSEHFINTELNEMHDQGLPSEHFINTELNEMHDQGLGNAFLVIIGSLLERILGGSAK